MACRITNWKDPLIFTDVFSPYVFLESIGNLLRDKYNFLLLATFRISQKQLPVVYIIWGELQDFADPHASPCHQFKDQSVSCLCGPKNNLVDGLFLDDIPVND
jgi:hypothetical protein